MAGQKEAARLASQIVAWPNNYLAGKTFVYSGSQLGLARVWQPTGQSRDWMMIAHSGWPQLVTIAYFCLLGPAPVQTVAASVAFDLICSNVWLDASSSQFFHLEMHSVRRGCKDTNPGRLLAGYRCKCLCYLLQMPTCGLASNTQTRMDSRTTGTLLDTST